MSCTSRDRRLRSRAARHVLRHVVCAGPTCRTRDRSSHVPGTHHAGRAGHVTAQGRHGTGPGQQDKGMRYMGSGRSLELGAVGPCAWRGQASGVAHLHLHGVFRARTAPSSAGGGPVEPLPPRA
eukprot:1592350-Rhodomonas_salina.1